MIVVISDLHFEEEASDIIRDHEGQPKLIFRRNLDARAYRGFMAAMAEQAERRRVREFRLVIAGDLFDFNRTVLWFEDELRPYVALNQVSGGLEAKILKILEATAAEKHVAQALETFRLLARGRFLRDPDTKNEGERDFPADRIVIECLAGNHDRLCNATPAVRSRVRELIGLQGAEPFAHCVQIEDPRALIRHGHEYDPNNFGEDYSGDAVIPADVPEEHYSAAPFGDFITINVATRLPHLLRKKYGDAEILAHDVLRGLYLRLLQFDDVRPQAALLDYLLDDSAARYDAEQAWERLVPILQQVLDEIHDHPFFRYWLRERVKPWSPAEIEAARGLLKLGGWRNVLAREASRKLAHYFLGGEPAGPETYATREQVLRERSVRLVLAGHTHSPNMQLVSADPQSDRYYINTGTWRTRIPATLDRRSFGRLEALTYVMLFSGAEETHRKAHALASVDYWTGLTRTWYRGGDREAPE